MEIFDILYNIVYFRHCRKYFRFYSLWNSQTNTKHNKKNLLGPAQSFYFPWNPAKTHLTLFLSTQKQWSSLARRKLTKSGGLSEEVQGHLVVAHNDHNCPTDSIKKPDVNVVEQNASQSSTFTSIDPSTKSSINKWL